MGNFIDFILNNIFLVAVFIGGIISWLNRMNGEQEEERPKRQPSPPNRTPSGPVRPKTEQVERDEQRPGKAAVESKMERYYQEKQKHIKDISDRNIGDKQGTGSFTYETPNQNIHDALPDQMERTKPRQYGKNETAPSLSIKSNLNRKKIAESVMMAEILGPPRAHKPHRTFSRRNNY
ncbi:hypothetical protein SAMN05421743_111108 [Thalassobacillus cyri]|uniref:Uncharacterized protein n=1 Tax=Thalassobacillus cyri TaxID=571932 RepID=A0A1H4FHD5_9BACI|nr:hypothetical protein [Thalassobacillus cyri]SEA96541.1 hypothetical protein SAMN05421743_111108 [Thalassobacillus cyri]